jgi:hypothetical protein
MGFGETMISTNRFSQLSFIIRNRGRSGIVLDGNKHRVFGNVIDG